MRVAILVIAVALFLFDWGGRRVPSTTTFPARTEIQPSSINPEPAATSTAKVDFDTQVKPILKSKCMPCHFPGGTMYTQLPFDRPETVRKLGTKLFSRIQDEAHRKLIRDFLEQQP